MKVVSTSNAPAAIGPYSQAIDLGNMVFVSGQIPVDPATGKMADTVEEQAAIPPVQRQHPGALAAAG